MKRFFAGSPSPSDAANSCCSCSGIWAISISIFAESTTTPSPRFSAAAWTSSGTSAPTASSATLRTSSSGFRVRKL